MVTIEYSTLWKDIKMTSDKTTAINDYGIPVILTKLFDAQKKEKHADLVSVQNKDIKIGGTQEELLNIRKAGL